MPLTRRTNGSGSSNLVGAAWWNDFMDLLTGVMTDQEITLVQNMALQAIGAAPSTVPTLALRAGTTMGIGSYNYVVTFVSADGESLPSASAGITTTSGNQSVTLSNIPTGPTGTLKRNIYRTAVGGTTYKFDQAVNDNTTTTVADALTDGNLGASPPTNPSFGGSLLVKDNTGTVQTQLFSNGAARISGLLTLLSGGLNVVDSGNNSWTGATSGTLTFYQPLQGTFKLVAVVQNNFKNGNVGAQTFPIPTPFTTFVHGWNSSLGGPFQVLKNGTAQTVQQLTALNAGADNSVSGTTTLHGNWLWHCDSGIDTISINGSQALASSGHMLLFGI